MGGHAFTWGGALLRAYSPGLLVTAGPAFPSWVRKTSALLRMHAPTLLGLARLVLRLAFGFAALTPGRAAASSVSNEVGGQATQTTPSNPRAGDVADLFKANIDVGESFVLRPAIGYTYEFGTAVPTGGFFKGTAASIFALSVGLDWEANDALTLSVDALFSPSSSQSADTVFTLTGPAGGIEQRDGLLQTMASSYGADFFADYLIGNPLADALAFAVDGDVGWLALNVDQALEKLENEMGTAASSVSRIRAFCNATKVSAEVRQCQALAPLLSSGTDTLHEFRLAAGGTVTVGGEIDVGLHGAFYLYNKDPSEFGYYSSLTSGRTDLHNLSLGNGVPLAPYRFTLRPDVTRRVGPVSLTLWYQFALYASDLGTSQVFGARLQWAIGQWWKVWLTGNVQVDLQPPFSTGSPLAKGTQTLISGALASGFRVAFE